MIVTTKQAAEFFGVADRTIRLWTKGGLPKHGHGKFDLKAAHEWWLENIYASTTETPDINVAKTEYWNAKARVETVKANEAEGSVIKRKSVVDSWAWRVAELSGGLGSLPMRLAPLVAGRSELETRNILEAEMWKLRDKFAREGTFTPKKEAKKAKKTRKGSKRKRNEK